jgi:hypothetical protein
MAEDRDDGHVPLSASGRVSSADRSFLTSIPAMMNLPGLLAWRSCQTA